MANTKKLQEITSVDATAVELVITDAFLPTDLFIVCDSANAGTVQFQVAKAGSVIGDMVWTGYKAWPAGVVPPIQLPFGHSLYYKASGAGQKFTPSC